MNTQISIFPLTAAAGLSGSTQTLQVSGTMIDHDACGPEKSNTSIGDQPVRTTLPYEWKYREQHQAGPNCIHQLRRQ